MCYANANCYSNDDANHYTNCYTFAYGNIDADGYSYRYGNGNTQSGANINCFAYAYSYTYTFTDSYFDTYRYGHAQTDADAAVRADGAASSNSSASPCQKYRGCFEVMCQGCSGWHGEEQDYRWLLLRGDTLQRGAAGSRKHELSLC